MTNGPYDGGPPQAHPLPGGGMTDPSRFTDSGFVKKEWTEESVLRFLEVKGLPRAQQWRKIEAAMDSGRLHQQQVVALAKSGNWPELDLSA